jgi:hypothetical protein
MTWHIGPLFHPFISYLFKFCSSLTIEDVNKFVVRVFPPPPPPILVGSVVRFKDDAGIYYGLEHNQMAVVFLVEGIGSRFLGYHLRTADGLEMDNSFGQGFLVLVDEADAVRCPASVHTQ